MFFQDTMIAQNEALLYQRVCDLQKRCQLKLSQVSSKLILTLTFSFQLLFLSLFSFPSIIHYPLHSSNPKGRGVMTEKSVFPCPFEVQVLQQLQGNYWRIMDKNKKKLEESKTGKWKEKKSFVYHISANRCRDNYYFFRLKVRQLFKGDNYSREETIVFQTIFESFVMEH